MKPRIQAIRLQQTGFTLIEILVAMLILAIGVLGIVALQFKGMQYNQDAYFRTQANILAYDIADRIRLNQDNADDYELDDWTIQDPGNGCDYTGTAATGAANDLVCWQVMLFNSLPPGDPDNDINNSASIISDGSGTYTIAITWTDREGSDHEIEYTFQL